MDPTNGAAPSARSPRLGWLAYGPLWIAALLVVLINGINLDGRVRAANPRNAWEAAEVVEGWRSLRGTPVYDLSPSGHATHMYGALEPWLQGQLFRWTGPSNQAGRVVTLVCALAAVTIVAVAAQGRRAAWLFLVGWALIFGTNFRAGDYFAENRPDLTALLFASMAVVLLAVGLERLRTSLVIAGSLCLIVGFFFKQPAVLFAAVPSAALVLRGRVPARKEVMLAVVPLAAAGCVIVGLKCVSPVHYHYMVELPKAYRLNPAKAVRVCWELLLDSPLFLLVVGEWLIVRPHWHRPSSATGHDPSIPAAKRAGFTSPRVGEVEPRRGPGAGYDTRPGDVSAPASHEDARLRWLVATLLVVIPISSVMTAKIGGTDNSLLPALLAMAAFCANRLPRLVRSIGSPLLSTRARVAVGAFLALVVLMSTFPHLSRQRGLFVTRSGQGNAYRKVIGMAAELPGTVVSPEDPTIALFAKQHAGRNVASEYDSHPAGGEWAPSPPARMLDEIRAADYVVDVHAFGQNLLVDSELEALGFERLDGLGVDPTYYRVWKNRRVADGDRLARGRAPGALSMRPR
jgi:hypothetical protein